MLDRAVAGLVLVLALVVTGCASKGDVTLDPSVHAAPAGSASLASPRVVLEHDLEPDEAKRVLDRLEKLELLLDERFPWLEKPTAPVRTIVVKNEAAFADLARAHAVGRGPEVFACSAAGELVVRHDAELFGAPPATPLPWRDGPRTAGLAEAAFRRRLEARHGAGLARTWLEEGCARRFSEIAAQILGEPLEAARRARADLATAFLPLYLGAPPTLVRTTAARWDPEARPQTRARDADPRGLAYAVARFLMESDRGGRADVLPLVFAAASGREPDGALEAALERLAVYEAAFESWTRARLEESLLDAIAAEPLATARWEASDALRFVSGLELPPDGSAERRRELVAKAREELGRPGRPVRLLDEYDAELRQVARSTHAQSDGQALVRELRRTIEQRSRGYGHPAIEDAKAKLGQVVAEALRRIARG